LLIKVTRYPPKKPFYFTGDAAMAGITLTTTEKYVLLHEVNILLPKKRNSLIKFLTAIGN